MSGLGLFRLAASDCDPSGFIPSIYKGLCNSAGHVEIKSLDQLLVVVANVVQILLTMAGSLAVIFIIVGGIWYVTAAGDPTRLKRAKEIIMNAVTGLVICIIAYTVVVAVASAF
jgi:hypothetical protein